MQISPTINIPGRSSTHNRLRAQSLIPPRARSLQDPGFLREKHVSRSTTTHYEGSLDIALDTEDTIWSSRNCSLDSGHFSFSTPLDNSALPEGRPFNQDKTIGYVPLELVATVRSTREIENAFTIILDDESRLTFRACHKTEFQEWLFFFHSSIVAVVDRMRVNRSSPATDSSFRAWRGNLGGSASFLSPEEKEKLNAGLTPPNSDFLRGPTREHSWNCGGQPSQSLQSGASWNHPHSPVSGRNRSQSIASVSGLGSLLSHSLNNSHNYFEGRSKRSPSLSGSSCSPASEEGGLVGSAGRSPPKWSQRNHQSGLSQSLQTRSIYQPPSVNTNLGGALAFEEDHSPPLFGSPPRRFERGSSAGSLDNGGDLLQGSLPDILHAEIPTSSRTSSGASSRRVSVEGGVFDLSLEDGELNSLHLSEKLQPHPKSSPPTSSMSMTPSRRIGSAVRKRCVQWHSAAYCAQGIKKSNEDAYYLSDDAATGSGYSSGEGLQGNPACGARGEASIDGRTSHGIGGGMTRIKSADTQVPVGFYGIYDGHAGKEAAEMLANELHAEVLQELGNLVNSGSPSCHPEDRADKRADGMTKAFLDWDTRFLEMARNKIFSGSTAVVALVVEGGSKVIVANLGDSGAIIVRRCDERPEVNHLSPSNMKETENESEDEVSFTSSRNSSMAETTPDSSEERANAAMAFTSIGTQCEADRCDLERDQQRWTSTFNAEPFLGAIPLSSDHKPNRPDEALRIEAAGGWVKMNDTEIHKMKVHVLDMDNPYDGSDCTKVLQIETYAVCGDLGVSRAFGDSDFKGYGANSHTAAGDGILIFNFPEGHSRTFNEDLVLVTPEVTEHVLEEEDEFLVMATDGLWDVATPEEVGQAVRRLKVRYQVDGHKGDKEAFCLYLAEQLTNMALRLGSADNITVTVVAFEYE